MHTSKNGFKPKTQRLADNGGDSPSKQGAGLGFKPRQSLADGGMVKGAGTGTSDDIKKQVPFGSYIMPADSTQQIGAPSLGALGFKPQQVPVNLSNGEYELPPEQVHAVGVQALDQMKGATHTPVADRGSKGFKPEFYFADGGLVDPEKIKQPISDVTRVGNSYSSNGSVGGNFAINGQQGGGGGAFDSVRNTAANAFGSVNANLLPETSRVTSDSIDKAGEQFSKGNYGQSIGAGLGGLVKGVGGLGYDLVARPIGAVAGFAGEVGKGIFGIEDSPTATAKPPAVTPSPKTVPNPLLAGATPAGLGLKPQSSNITLSPTQDASAQAPNAAVPSASGIIRNGNSFSDGKSAGVGADGITSLNPQWNSKQNISAKNTLFGGTPTFGEGQPTPQPAALGFNPNTYQTAQNTAAQVLNARRYDANIQRDNELRMIVPRSGANGQYTVAQQNARMQLINGKSAGDLPQYTTDVNNALGLQKQQMSDQAASDRAAMQEQGANYRSDNNNSTDLTKFSATNDLANREFNSGADVRGFASQQARRMSKVLSQYDAAKTTEERKALSEQIQQLNGKEQPNRFTVVPGGQEYDPQAMAMVNRPGQVLNNQTGEFVGQPSTGGTSSKGGFAQPSSAAEYNALPKGAKYMKDGQLRIKN